MKAHNNCYLQHQPVCEIIYLFSSSLFELEKSLGRSFRWHLEPWVYVMVSEFVDFEGSRGLGLCRFWKGFLRLTWNVSGDAAPRSYHRKTSNVSRQDLANLATYSPKTQNPYHNHNHNPTGAAATTAISHHFTSSS